MAVIYEPAGAAREYAALACNLFTGCTHGCGYCYAPACLRRTRQAFHGSVRPRKDILRSLQREAAELAARGDKREILLCFACDPYPPDELAIDVTREALAILAAHGLRATVLTKGGLRAERDLWIFQTRRWRFGTSIIWDDEEKRKAWEPYAAPLASRREAIKEAKRRGIETWVSLEPVIEPSEALAVIRRLHAYVDQWQLGRINHDAALVKRVDWPAFVAEATLLLDELGAAYTFKRSLRQYVEVTR